MAVRADDQTLLGAIEAGGTKFVLATGTADGTIKSRHSIATANPEVTLAEARDWFATQPRIWALGIASFGPVELERRSPQWGHITETPKPGWSDCDLAGYFARELNVPIGFDTDVNAAALGEYRFGAGRGLSGMAYITVGTGIGGGLIINGKLARGAGHPEMGITIPAESQRIKISSGIAHFTAIVWKGCQAARQFWHAGARPFLTCRKITRHTKSLQGIWHRPAIPFSHVAGSSVWCSAAG